MRAGSIEVMRKQMFEEALKCTNSEKRMVMYEALVGEEERLKRLALEEERTRQKRESLELQRQRVQIEMAKSAAGYFVEALRILQEEGKAAELKVAQAVAELQRWKDGAIDAKNMGQCLLEEKSRG